MNAETATDLGLVTHLVDINDVPNCITEIHAQVSQQTSILVSR